MRRHLATWPVVFLLLASAGSAFGEVLGSPSKRNLHHQPVAFEPNGGQANPAFDFLAEAQGRLFCLRSDVLSMQTAAAQGSQCANADASIALLGARVGHAIPQERRRGLRNYLLGDRSQWITHLPMYGRVRYAGVYPGIDVEYYSREGKIELDFKLAPGADPSLIRLQVRGANKLKLAASGDLLIYTPSGELRLQKPGVYQEAEGGQRSLDGGFRLLGEGVVGFRLASYDRHRPLVIDPAFIFSTYLGTSWDDGGTGVAVDGSGNIYASINAHILYKFKPDGTLIYKTSVPVSAALAVDAAGNAYLVGVATYLSFVATPGSFQPTNSRGYPLGVMKLNATGDSVVWASFLGGSNFENAGTGRIAVDTAGEVVVTGVTGSNDFPLKNATQSVLCCATAGFVTKFDPTGSSVVYSTYLGGSSSAYPNAVTLDGAGNAYVVGETYSADYPTLNAFQSTRSGGGTRATGFVTKFSATGAYLYSTYLGGSGSGPDYVNDVAVNSAGNATVVGYTLSPDFPVLNAYQPTFAGSLWNAFITEFDVSGSALVYSTFLGGPNAASAAAVALDASGNAYVVGSAANDFPLQSPLDSVPPVNYRYFDFLFVLDTTHQQPVYSTFVGNRYPYTSYVEGPADISLDGNGNAFVVGTATSGYPLVDAAFDFAGGRTDGSYSDAYLVAITPADQAATSLPLGLSLGSVPVGSSNSGNISLRNMGSAALAITSITVSDGAFTQSNDCGTGLAGGGTGCTITVTFIPKTTGTLTGTLTVTDSSSGSPHTVPLSGTGAMPVASLSPNPLTFSDQAVGTAVSKTVTLSNTGSADLTIGHIGISGANAADFTSTNTCGAGISAGSSCGITVTFTPSAMGARSAQLSVTDNAADSPQTVVLSGNGGDFALAPASGSSTSATVSAGQTATYNINLAPAVGFNGAVTLSCAGAPDKATCAVSPASATLSGSVIPITVTVTTAATSAASPAMSAHLRHGGSIGFGLLLPGVFLLLSGVPIGRRRLLAAFAILAVLAMCMSCGGGGGGGSPSVSPVTPTPVPGTPAGTYTLTLAASAGGATHSQSLTLVVK